MIDPNEITKMNLDQLVEAYVNASDEEEQIVAEKVMLREAMLPLIPSDGTVVGDFAVTRVKKGMLRMPTKTKEKRAVMEALKELGCVKVVEQPDHKAAEALFEKGVKLPVEFSYTITPRVARVQESETE